MSEPADIDRTLRSEAARRRREWFGEDTPQSLAFDLAADRLVEQAARIAELESELLTKAETP